MHRQYVQGHVWCCRRRYFGYYCLVLGLLLLRTERRFDRSRRYRYLGHLRQIRGAEYHHRQPRLDCECLVRQKCRHGTLVLGMDLIHIVHGRTYICQFAVYAHIGLSATQLGAVPSRCEFLFSTKILCCRHYGLGGNQHTVTYPKGSGQG